MKERNKKEKRAKRAAARFEKKNRGREAYG